VRSLPPQYLTPNSSSNSLWDANRNAGIAAGGNLPATDATQARIDTLYMLTDFATFGGNATKIGAIGSDPHGIIHADVGLPAPPRLDMGSFGYAARDPIFWAHHCNIDKVWSGWNDLAGGGGLPAGAYTNPTDSSFLGQRWSFYDEKGNTVSISAGDVLDHKSNLRYTYTLKPVVVKVQPPVVIGLCKILCCLPGPERGSFIEVTDSVREAALTALRQQSPILLVMHDAQIPSDAVGSFDILAVRGERRVHLGSLGLVSNGGAHGPQTIVLDITRVTLGLLAKERPASLLVVRRSPGQRPGVPSALAAPGRRLEAAFDLKAEHAEIRAQRR